MIQSDDRFIHRFRFRLEQPVVLTMSGERGIVIGRSDHVHSSDQYNVRYTAADGRQVENWWDEGALIAGDVARKADDAADTDSDGASNNVAEPRLCVGSIEPIEGAALLAPSTPERVINIYVS